MSDVGKNDGLKTDFLKTVASISKGKNLEPIYTLLGSDYILRRRALEAISARVHDVFGDSPQWERFYYDESGAEGAILACQTLSLFATQSFVMLENCTAFLPNAKNKFNTEGLEAYLQQPNPESILVISIPGEKMDERKKMTKQLKQYPLIDCNTPKDDIALGILRQEVQEKHIQIQPNALEELWRRCANLTQSVTELTKLGTYTDGDVISLADVDTLVAEPPEDNVFRWIETIIKGKLEVVYASMSDIQKAGYDGFALLAMLARQLRLMWFAKVLGLQGKTHQQIASQVGGHPYAIKVAAGQAEGFTQKRLEQLITIVADAEYAVKSGRRDISQVLDFVILSFAVKDTHRRAR